MHWEHLAVEGLQITVDKVGYNVKIILKINVFHSFAFLRKLCFANILIFCIFVFKKNKNTVPCSLQMTYILSYGVFH